VDILVDKLNKSRSWLIWIIVISLIEVIFIVFYHFHSGFHRTVLGAYYGASTSWIHGRPIYDIGTIGGFNYFLQSAILFIPFALLPFRVCVLLWFFINVALLWLGVYLVVSQFDKSQCGHYKKGAFNLYLFWMMLWCLGLGFGALRNGQMNMFIMILTLFVVYCLQNKKDGWVSVWLNLGLALKPTMIILYLLILGCRPKIFPKLLLGLVIVIGFPFLTQSPNYVISQYHDSWLNFTSTITLGVETTNWASIFNALKVFNLGLPKRVVDLVIVVMALLTYGYTLFLYRRHGFKAWVWSLACMATIYLLLFNPRTENNGYILIAPFLGYLIASAWSHKRFWLVTSLFIMGLLIALNYDISRNLIHGTTSWVSPLVTVVFVIYWICFVDFRRFKSFD
jgi:alpha-1,2-mannosyltransferase